MKYLKDYGFTLLKFLGFLIGGSIIISIFYYLLFSTKVTNIFSFTYMILLFALFGFREGKKAESKGFIAGLKIGFLMLTILILFNLIFYQTGFFVIRILYYMVLVFASVVGSTIGINAKKE